MILGVISCTYISKQNEKDDCQEVRHFECSPLNRVFRDAAPPRREMNCFNCHSFGVETFIELDSCNYRLFQKECLVSRKQRIVD